MLLNKRWKNLKKKKPITKKKKMISIWLILSVVVILGVILLVKNGDKFGIFNRNIVNFILRIGINKILGKIVAIIIVSFVKCQWNIVLDPTSFLDVAGFSGSLMFLSELLTIIFSNVITFNLNLGQLLFGLHFAGIPNGFENILNPMPGGNVGGGTSTDVGASNQGGANNPGADNQGGANNVGGANNPSTQIEHQGNGYHRTRDGQYDVYGDPVYKPNGSNQPFASNLARAMTNAYNRSGHIKSVYNPNTAWEPIYGANGNRFLEDFFRDRHVYRPRNKQFNSPRVRKELWELN